MENFRWADLVQGPEEEPRAHSTWLQHLSGPGAPNSQVVVSMRPRADQALRSPPSVVQFWRKTSTNVNLTTVPADRSPLAALCATAPLLNLERPEAARLKHVPDKLLLRPGNLANSRLGSRLEKR